MDNLHYIPEYDYFGAILVPYKYATKLSSVLKDLTMSVDTVDKGNTYIYRFNLTENPEYTDVVRNSILLLAIEDQVNATETQEIDYVHLLTEDHRNRQVIEVFSHSDCSKHIGEAY